MKMAALMIFMLGCFWLIFALAEVAKYFNRPHQAKLVRHAKSGQGRWSGRSGGSLLKHLLFPG